MFALRTLFPPLPASPRDLFRCDNITPISSPLGNNGDIVTIVFPVRGPADCEENRLSREVNKEIRSQEGYAGPGGSWLSDALRLHRAWGDLFHAGTKQGTYDAYRLIVTSSLNGTEKFELRRWLERNGAN